MVGWLAMIRLTALVRRLVVLRLPMTVAWSSMSADASLTVRRLAVVG